MPKTIHRELFIFFLCLSPAFFACKPTCAISSDCDSGQVCATGVCMDACHSASDCPSGQVCTDRVCQAEPPPVDDPNQGTIRPSSITVFETTYDANTDALSVNPARDVTVVIHASDGTPLSTITTAWDGYAGFVLPEGGMITVLPPPSWGYGPTTVADLEPGSSLSFGRFEPSAAPALKMTLTSSFTATPREAKSFHVFTGCNGFFSEMAYFADYCLDSESHGTALAIAYRDLDEQEPIAFSILDGFNPRGVASLAFSDWRTDWAYKTINVRGLGPSELAGGYMFGFRNNALFTFELVSNVAPDANGTSVLSFREAPGLATRFSRNIYVEHTRTTTRTIGYSSSLEDDRSDAEVEADVQTSSLLASITDFAVDNATAHVRWSAPSGGDVDYGRLTLHYGPADNRWVLLFDPSRTELALPHFPLDVFFAPKSIASASFVELSLLDESDVHGYADALKADQWTGRRAVRESSYSTRASTAELVR